MRITTCKRPKPVYVLLHIDGYSVSHLIIVTGFLGKQNVVKNWRILDSVVFSCDSFHFNLVVSILKLNYDGNETTESLFTEFVNETKRHTFICQVPSLCQVVTTFPRPSTHLSTLPTPFSRDITFQQQKQKSIIKNRDDSCLILTKNVIIM